MPDAYREFVVAMETSLPLEISVVSSVDKTNGCVCVIVTGIHSVYVNAEKAILYAVHPCL